MTWFGQALPALLIFALSMAPVEMRAATQDPRPLTASEMQVFLPPVCAKAVVNTDDHDPDGMKCADIIGYPKLERSEKESAFVHPSLKFESIILGNLSAIGKDEAYISYNASFEAHVTLFGGGILFVREKGVWRLVAWYPAEQRGECLSLPDSIPLEMLCTFHDGYADAMDRALYVTYALPQAALARTDPTFSLRQDISIHLENAGCEEEREDPANLPPNPCGYWKKGKGFILDIGTLQRSHDASIFAELPITYATPQDVAAACHAGCFIGVKNRDTILKFTLHGRQIETRLPINPMPYPD
jgi:hypothetical protein